MESRRPVRASRREVAARSTRAGCRARADVVLIARAVRLISFYGVKLLLRIFHDTLSHRIGNYSLKLGEFVHLFYGIRSEFGLCIQTSTSKQGKILMLQHDDIWRAVDRLASKYGMSPSGLARKAGLDPTSFNKSKRTSKDGKRRWLGTESVAKMLDATGASLDEFVGLIGDNFNGSTARRIPIIGLGQAGQEGQFDPSGQPAGGNWDEILFPCIVESQVFALEVTGESLAPVYRDGDILVVSPEASVRRGDRVVAKLHSGEILVMRLVRQSATKVELTQIIGDDGERSIDVTNLAWICRVLWASQ